MTLFDSYWIEFETNDSGEIPTAHIIAESFQDALQFAAIHYDKKRVLKISRNFTGMRLADETRDRIRSGG